MATTSLWRIKGYLGSVLLYAENPDKTTVPATIPVPEDVNRNALDDVIAYAERPEATCMKQLVSGVNCIPEIARDQMLKVKREFGKEDGTIAYHGYQAFREGEVTPREAHNIGLELARELWGQNYQVLVATHVDKESHIHNHFVINTVSWVDGIKFHRTKDDYMRMREVSDRLCLEHGLSVIRNPQGKGKHYGEWKAEREGRATNSSLIRADIDRAIAASLTERDFYDLLEEWGYEFKFYSKNGELLERPSLRPQGAERFRRFDRLGDNYSVEAICERILDNYTEKDPFPEEEERRYRQYRKDNPPKPKAKGLAALYYYYCYELKIIVRFPGSVKRVSQTMRDDLRKLDRLDEQTRLLGENKIETLEDLDAYRATAKEKLRDLEEERNRLRNELRRVLRSDGVEAALQVKKNITRVSGKIKKIRTEFKICDRIEERSATIQAELDALIAEQRGKENADELFGRRSGTGREDVPQRR